MNRAEAIDCWLRHEAGEVLSAEESQALGALLQTDAALRAAILDDQALDGLLRLATRCDRTTGAFTAGVATLIAARHDASRFSRQVRRRLRSVRRDRRPGRGRWWLLAAGLLLAIGALAILARDRSGDQPPVLTACTGDVLAGVAVGARLPPDSRLDSRSGTALLTWDDGTRCTIGSGTRLALTAGPGKQLLLEEGRVTVAASPQSGDRPLRLRTPEAELTVLGTRFTCASRAGTSILDVREGRVRFAAKGSESLVAAGMRGLADGSGVTTGPCPVFAWHGEDGDAPQGLMRGSLATAPDGRRCLAAMPAPGQDDRLVAITFTWDKGLFTVNPDLEVHCSLWLGDMVRWAGFYAQDWGAHHQGQWHIPLNQRQRWVRVSFRLADLVAAGNPPLLRPGDTVRILMIQAQFHPGAQLFIDDLEILPGPSAGTVR